MTALIRNSAKRRGITRLCHFTPSRNLSHITDSPIGILASRHLQADEKAIFNPTDMERLDNHPNHVCCSIQYPNAWYFKIARRTEVVFPDWVVLLINPRYLWHNGTKFSPHNAATGRGKLIGEGVEAFEAMFARIVKGAGRHYTRGPCHPKFLPTDEQAEVLVPDIIELQDVIGVAVCDDAQAKREVTRLKQLGLSKFPPFRVIPEFFDPKALSRDLRAGRIPSERSV